MYMESQLLITLVTFVGVSAVIFSFWAFARYVRKNGDKWEGIYYSKSFRTFAEQHNFFISKEVSDDVYKHKQAYKLPLSYLNVNTMMRKITDFIVTSLQGRLVYIYKIACQKNVYKTTFPDVLRGQFLTYAVIDIKLLSPKHDFAGVNDARISLGQNQELLATLSDKSQVDLGKVEAEKFPALMQSNYQVRLNNGSLVVFYEGHKVFYYQTAEITSEILETIYQTAINLLSYVDAKNEEVKK